MASLNFLSSLHFHMFFFKFQKRNCGKSIGCEQHFLRQLFRQRLWKFCTKIDSAPFSALSSDKIFFFNKSLEKSYEMYSNLPRKAKPGARSSVHSIRHRMISHITEPRLNSAQSDLANFENCRRIISRFSFVANCHSVATI